MQRFKGGFTQGNSEAIPGPGQYYHEPKWIKSGGTGSAWNNKSQAAMLPNPPSIPSHNNVFGYEENEKGELIRQ